MARACTAELRERVLPARERGGPSRAPIAAGLLGVGEGTLRRWRQARRTEGRRAAERDRSDLVAARAAWRAELAGIEPRRLVSLDEGGGVDTRMGGAHGRAAGGQRRATGKVPGGHRKRLTVPGAPATEGVPAVMSVAAATSTRARLPRLCRAGADPGLAPAIAHRHLPAGPRARPEPDRALLGEARGPPARQGGAEPGRARRRARPGRRWPPSPLTTPGAGAVSPATLLPTDLKNAPAGGQGSTGGPIRRSLVSGIAVAGRPAPRAAAPAGVAGGQR